MHFGNYRMGRIKPLVSEGRHGFVAQLVLLGEKRKTQIALVTDPGDDGEPFIEWVSHEARIGVEDFIAYQAPLVRHGIKITVEADVWCQILGKETLFFAKAKRQRNRKTFVQSYAQFIHEEWNSYSSPWSESTGQNATSGMFFLNPHDFDGFITRFDFKEPQT